MPHALMTVTVYTIAVKGAASISAIQKEMKKSKIIAG